MSQNTVNYANNPTGPELLDNYLAKEQENTLSSNSGIQRPSYAISGTPWLDTSVTPWQYKIYDGSRDAVVGSLDNSSHTFTVSNINDSNLVHLSGTETITGMKVFTASPKMRYTNVIYNDNLTRGTTPQSSQYIQQYMVDSTRSIGDNTAFGLYRVIVTNGNNVYSTMQAFKNVVTPSGSGAACATLRVYYNTNNDKYGVELYSQSTGTDVNESMSLATNATDSYRIPTMGWVNNPATSTNVVHRTGDETIGGNKTFTSNIKVYNGDPRVQIINSGITKGTAPASGEVQGVGFRDKDEKLLGVVQSQYGDSTGTSKATLTKIVAYKASSASDTANANITIGYDSSGNVYTYAPTPSSSSDHSTKIATTDWCQTAFANAIGTPRDVTILWGNGTGTGSPTEFSLSEKFTKFEQIGFVCSTDSGAGREMCIQSTYWLNWLLSNSGNNSVVLGHGGQTNFYIRSYTASSNPSTNTKFKVGYEDGIAYYIFGINRKVKTVTDPLA